MKVLVIFADMLRANRLSTFNDAIGVDTPVDKSFKELGGTIYKNCFTPRPDTPGGISSFTTGLPPYLNGCDIRVKWMREFLDPNLKTVYDLFLDKGYKVDFLSDPRERAVGLFPEHISNMEIHNSVYNIDEYLDKLVLEDDHFIFLCTPQFHWTLDAYGASQNGEKHGLDDIAFAFNKIFTKLDKEQFDHTFIFSDHGFKFSHEVKVDPDFMLINEDRTNTVLIHRQKYDDKLVVNDKLCSLTDIYSTFQEILGDKSYGFSLLQDNERDYVVIEDHIKFLPEVNQNLELWGVVNKASIYIRTLTEAFLIDRKSHNVVSGVIEYFDLILESESSYKKYKTEHERIFVYSSNLQKLVGNDYRKLYDFRRNKRSPLISGYFKVKDLIFRLLKDLPHSKKHKQ